MMAVVSVSLFFLYFPQALEGGVTSAENSCVCCVKLLQKPII